jgi:hypothetical protein
MITIKESTIVDYVTLLKNIKEMRKVLEFTKFFFVSVPLACVLFVLAHTAFELKRILKKYLVNK